MSFDAPNAFQNFREIVAMQRLNTIARSLLYAQQQSLGRTSGMFAKRRQGKPRHLLDHLVGAGEKSRGNFKVECFSRRKIDHKFELGRLLDRYIGGLRTVEDLVD